MEVIAKENKVTILDHDKGSLTEKVVDDPMEIPRSIAESWRPQFIDDDLPDTFCGNMNLLNNYIFTYRSTLILVDLQYVLFNHFEI